MLNVGFIPAAPKELTACCSACASAYAPQHSLARMPRSPALAIRRPHMLLEQAPLIFTIELLAMRAGGGPAHPRSQRLRNRSVPIPSSACGCGHMKRLFTRRSRAAPATQRLLHSSAAQRGTARDAWLRERCQQQDARGTNAQKAARKRPTYLLKFLSTARLQDPH